MQVRTSVLLVCLLPYLWRALPALTLFDEFLLRSSHHYPHCHSWTTHTIKKKWVRVVLLVILLVVRFTCFDILLSSLSPLLPGDAD
jgi:hypothetical protein